MISRMCCCGGECLSDCIIGSEIQHGCCHKKDTLLLWCERPSYSLKVNYPFSTTFPIGSPTHERCDVTTFNRQDPVQAIYTYHDCYYRAIAVDVTTPLESLAQIGTKCRDETCEPEDWIGVPPCEGDCCQPEQFQDADCCPCKASWLSPWRLEKLKGYTNNVDWCVPDILEKPEGYDQFKWLVETTCHKNGAALAADSADCCTIEGFSQCARLYDQVVGVIHFERWWKAEPCADNAHIVVPGGLGGFQTDELVPKWWIFACSGIPLYAGDLCDAVRWEVITQSEAEDLIQQIQDPIANGMPDQAVLHKLGKAGYLGVKDWRPEQRQAFVELHARFPSAGYDAFIEDVEDMEPLGPFRKRMTYGTVGVSANPLLRAADVTAETNLGDLQSAGMLPFPGGTQDDYDYWCERQWVYFRARPGGWQWAGWEEGQGQAEIESILLGNGRNDPNCVEALRGNPRTDVDCEPCETCDESLIECSCDECPEHVTPVYQCVDRTYDTKEGLVATPCESISFSPICEGLAITSYRYDVERTFVRVEEECIAQDTWKCIVETRSFLVEARRSVDSWDDSIPYRCRREAPPLPVFTDWPDMERTHKAPVVICSYINGCAVQSENNPLGKTYEISEICCGGYCSTCPEPPPEWPPELGNFCFIEACGDGTICTIDETSEQVCPPHETPSQIDCIGHEPQCDEPTP